MHERYIYKEAITLIHGQTYSLKNFVPLREKQFSQGKDIFIIPENINDFHSIQECLTLSNHRVFMNRYSHLDGVYNINCNGSVGIAVRWALVLTHKDINRDINKNCIDDKDLKELMDEWEQKEISRIISELYPLINLDHFSLDFKNIIAEYNQEQINELINTAILELALEWSYNEDLAKQITGKMLLPFIGDIILIENCKDFSLLKDYKWHCTYTQDLYDSYFDQ